MKTVKKNLVHLLKDSFNCFSKLLVSKVLRPARVFGCFDVNCTTLTNPENSVALISSHKTPHDHFPIDFEDLMLGMQVYMSEHTVFLREFDGKFRARQKLEFQLFREATFKVCFPKMKEITQFDLF